MNAYAMRSGMDLHDYGTSIAKADFERDFYRTTERVTFTFNGWDGKSYNGESRSAKVIRTRIEGYQDARFVKVGKSLHYIDEAWMVTEKATGEEHPTAGWLIDVK